MPRKPVENDEWERRRDAILRLYVTEDKSLSTVMTSMQRLYGFSQTKAQYERFFKAKGIKKNRTAADWKLVSSLVEERSKQGKESVVYNHDALVPPAKVTKETSRHGFKTTWERCNPGLIPSLSQTMPAGIRILTPPPRHFSPKLTMASGPKASSDISSHTTCYSTTNFLEWAQCTPWRQFMDHIYGSGQSSTTVLLRLTPSSQTPNSIDKHSAGVVQSRDNGPSHTEAMVQGWIDKILDSAFVIPNEDHLRELVCHWIQPNLFLPPFPAKSPFGIDTSKVFDITMPNTQSEFSKLAIMLLSEGFASDYVAPRVVETLHDRRNSSLFQGLLEKGLLSVHASAEKLLIPAIEEQNLECVKLLAHAGVHLSAYLGTFRRLTLTCRHISKDRPIHGRDFFWDDLDEFRSYADVPVTALAYAVWSGNATILGVLLETRRQLGHHPHFTDTLAFALTVRYNRLNMLDLLMKTNPRLFDNDLPTLNILEAAAAYLDASNYEALLERGIDLTNSRYGSVLAAAVYNAGQSDDRFQRHRPRYVELISHLVRRKADLNAPRRGRPKTWPRKFGTRQALSLCGMTALHCALYNNDFEVVQMLVNGGANPNQQGHGVFPIQIAAAFCDVRTVVFLLENGADTLTTSFVNEDGDPEPKDIAVEKRNDCPHRFKVIDRTPVNKMAAEGDETWVHKWSQLKSRSVAEICLIRGRKDLFDAFAESGAFPCSSTSPSSLYCALLGRNPELITMMLNLLSEHILEPCTLKEILRLHMWNQIQEHMSTGILRWGSRTLDPSVIGTAVAERDLAFLDFVLRPSNAGQILSPYLGATGLAMAAHRGYRDIVMLFLDIGIKPFMPATMSGSSNGLSMSALTLTVEACNRFYLCIDDISENKKCRPHQETCFDDEQIGMIRLLVDRCKDPEQNLEEENQRKRVLAEALASAVECKTTRVIPVIKFLVDAGAELVLAEDYLSYSLLQCALHRQAVPSAQCLLDLGARVDGLPHLSHTCCRNTALQQAAQLRDVDLIERLLSLGADVNAAPLDNWQEQNQHITGTALQFAAGLCNVATALALHITFDRVWVHDNRIDVVELLLRRGAYINAPPTAQAGRTVLQVAAEVEDMDLVKLLLGQGADVNGLPAMIRGATALQFAAFKGNFEMLNILLEHGAEINAPPATWDGRTAIEGAAEHGRLDMVRYLLEGGADVRGKGNPTYRRTVYRAWRAGHDALLRMVQTFKAKTWGSDDCDAVKNIVETMRCSELNFTSADAAILWHTEVLQVRNGATCTNLSWEHISVW